MRWFTLGAAAMTVLAPVSLHAQERSAPPQIGQVAAEQHDARRGAVDAPQPPGAINALPTHVMLPVPLGADNGLPQPSSPPSAAVPAGGPGAPCDLKYYVNRAVTPAGAPRLTICEPSAACNRDVCLATGNLYAALSVDAGMTWGYTNPATAFPAIDAGFCCDQRALYVPSRDITIWLLQYNYSGTTQNGSMRIAISAGRDDLRGGIWNSYVFNPQSFGMQAGLWLDFPDVAYSNGHLYASSNVFVNNSGFNWSSVIWKMDLDVLRDAGNLTYAYWTRGGLGSSGSYRLTQNATSTMRAGAHVTTSSLRVFSNADQPLASSMTWVDHAVPNWGGNAFIAPSPTGVNWALRGDTRILGAYSSGLEYGFLWGVGRFVLNGTRPQPFVRVLRIVAGFPATEDIWSATEAFLYPAVATNSAGHMGATVANGSAANHPRSVYRIVDGSCNTAFAGTWSVAANGTNTPAAQAWGDYFDVQRHPTEPMTFVATGMSQIGGSGNQSQTPRYLWFGREQDEPVWVRLTVQDTITAGGFPITVAETDLDNNKDGTSNFARRYMPGQRVKLTAPPNFTISGKVYLFQRWRHQSTPGGGFVDKPFGQTVLTIADLGVTDDVAECVYVPQVRLTMKSSNADGVFIKVEPPDLEGMSDGQTTFERYYAAGADVVFTAPASHGNQPFRRWWVAEVPQPIGQRVLPLMIPTADTELTAEFCQFTQGTAEPFGQGCVGSNRLPPDHSTRDVPTCGEKVALDVRGVFGTTSGALFLGFSNHRWNGVRLPLSLGFIGADPSCSILTEVVFNLPMTIDAAGFGNRSLGLASDPSTIGTHFYTQVIVIDPGVSSPLKLVVSNGLDLLIGGSHLSGQKCP